jgi:branched-chain amino acid transport system permease protein
MNWVPFLEQVLNGLQFGVMLFLLAAGLTLVLGIMNFINLAHGSFYMLGAYFAITAYEMTGSFFLSLLCGCVAALAVGVAVEALVIRRFYMRDHLDQVLVTFGLILFFNEAVRIGWGPAALHASVPSFLAGHVEIFGGVTYPVYRLAIIAVGLSVAAAMHVLISYTKLGMLIRAGATNRVMVGALGINIGLLNLSVFGLGVVLAALAGIMAAPIVAVEPGMGESILILTFVVIVLGGIGSVGSAFAAAMLVGMVDTMGRILLRPALLLVFPARTADAAGPGLASITIYLLMAVVLCFWPKGLLRSRS